MDFPIKLTENLIIHDIDSLHNSKSLQFHCTFFGQDCEALIKPDGEFSGGEAPSEIADSFFAQMEDEHTDRLIEIANEFLAEYGDDE